MSTAREAVKTVEREHKDRMKEEKAKLKDPVLKKLPVGFADEADKMGEEQLRDCIVESENNIKRTLKEIDGNEKLNGAKAIIQDIMGPFNDAKKAQQAKIQYCLRLLGEKGLIDDGEE